ncbi:SRPBCC family protein [Streptomyces sp. A2-16]|uniref:SRPBCC family protein n=1 Tax=Streptomyces sp. A2-16 TaxID=2781734 RepID=UPI001BAEBA53|nr:SRPBCC family protein [Streptomyces sp. A2-16]QUC61861.1 SRPBCC family protein [Streptomyces sp. A2-16]
MPRIENAIVIGADAELVFDLTNDIARWSEIFDEYSDAKVLSEEREGRWTEIVFELTNEEGASWRSWRILDHRELVAVAERRDPLYPFRYMHLRWSYEPVPEGTAMTWVQDFELDEKFPVPLETVLERMNTHTRHNQAGIKRKIESGDVRP